MALFLLLAAALAAPAPAQTPAPAQAPAAKSRPARRKGGRGSASAEEGPDLDAAARREIACPKGFVAEQEPGPHLVVADKDKAKKTRRRAAKKSDLDDGESPGPKKRTLARRCVPAASTKKASAEDKTPRRSAAEALRD